MGCCRVEGVGPGAASLLPANEDRVSLGPAWGLGSNLTGFINCKGGIKERKYGRVG